MEQEIVQLLKQSAGQAFSFKEVGKILDRQRYREDPNWARTPLNMLAGRQMVEKDKDGRFLVPSPAAKPH
jgi:hypothetical protein